MGNRPLEELMQGEMDRLGPVAFDEADRAFARDIQKTLTEDDIEATFRRIGMMPDAGMSLCDFVAPLDRKSEGGEGSTDVGDVSWAVPTVQARVATCAIGTPFHTWQTVAQGKAPAAHKGMVYAAKIMAATAVRLISQPDVLASAQAEHEAKLARVPYESPLSPEAQPPIVQPPA